MHKNDDITLHIKNMVCDRCIRVVGEELEKMGLQFCHIELGKVVFEQDPKDLPLDKIGQVLLDSGFEIIENKKAKLVEAAKNLIIKLIQKNVDDNPLNINYSDYLSKKLAVNYNYLSTLFSSVENITLNISSYCKKLKKQKNCLSIMKTH